MSLRSADDLAAEVEQLRESNRNYREEVKDLRAEREIRKAALERAETIIAALAEQIKAMARR